MTSDRANKILRFALALFLRQIEAKDEIGIPVLESACSTARIDTSDPFLAGLKAADVQQIIDQLNTPKPELDKHIDDVMFALDQRLLDFYIIKEDVRDAITAAYDLADAKFVQPQT